MTHDITNDLFHNVALVAYVGAAIACQGWPESDAVKELAYRLYEENLQRRNQPVATGRRFRLTREVDRFPDFLAPVGLTGTVDHIEESGTVWGKMDEPLPGAEEWDNCIMWDTPGDFLQDAEVL
jgi:hypothetical protein